MATRRSIHIDGLSHLTEIPVATKIGPLVVSSVIAPFDPGTRHAPDDIGAQLENIFTHVGAMLDAAGVNWADIAKMDFWAPSSDTRAAIDPVWIRHFPDPESRPARHTHTGGGNVITASFLAYAGA